MSGDDQRIPGLVVRDSRLETLGGLFGGFPSVVPFVETTFDPGSPPSNQRGIVIERFARSHDFTEALVPYGGHSAVASCEG